MEHRKEPKLLSLAFTSFMVRILSRTKGVLLFEPAHTLNVS